MKKEQYIESKSYAKLSPGDRIKIACELSGMTQLEIAHRAGLRPPHLNEMIHGKRPIGLDVAQRLSKVLGLSVIRLLDIADEASRKEVEAALMKIKKHVEESETIGEVTEKILLKDIDEAIEANRKAS
jgi:transcriptional regulator with XRE-family HTH domain